MKVNETLEKIYINSSLEDRIWLIGKGDTSFIEYTRTDAFIEKATKWFLNHAAIYFGHGCVYPKDLADDFRKAMKDEEPEGTEI